MKKKKLFYLLLIVMCFCLVGCTKKEETKEMYHDLKKVTDYLYEISYDDYVYDTELKTAKGIEEFACSSVKNGNFYGRNFDFIFNDVPEFIVKMSSNELRHASIGIANLSSIHEGDNFLEDDKEMMELLPNLTLDGINDSGVVCSYNVVPKQDTEEVTGTNPEGEKLHSLFIPRFVLDNASSADEAIELLESRNIYGDAGEHYDLHIMIADKDKTYIVEFIDNKMVAEEKTGNEQIMTNYYNNMDELTENAAGVERYQLLQENYDEGSTFDGMWNLLKKVKYSQTYLFDNNWNSEFLTQSMIKNIESEETKEYINLIKKLKQNYWIARTYDERIPTDANYWLTTHNSTYDIAKRKLRVTIQENYKTYYEYTLD